MATLGIEISPLDRSMEVKKLVNAWHSTNDPFQSTRPHIRLLCCHGVVFGRYFTIRIVNRLAFGIFMVPDVKTIDNFDYPLPHFVQWLLKWQVQLCQF